MTKKEVREGKYNILFVFIVISLLYLAISFLGNGGIDTLMKAIEIPNMEQSILDISTINYGVSF